MGHGGMGMAHGSEACRKRGLAAHCAGLSETSRRAQAGCHPLGGADKGADMTKDRKSSHPKMGEGPSTHKGSEQHGWSPDVDQTEQQKNESAHRSFHPERYAPEKDSSKESAERQEKVPPHERGEERDAQRRKARRRDR